jgi:predicted membrane-bound spermidine synthase
MKISGGVPKLVPPMLRPYRIFVGAKHERDHLWDSRKNYIAADAAAALTLMLRPSPIATYRQREHPVFETTLVRAKHSDYQLLVLTERLFDRMLRPYIIGMLTRQRA